MPTGKNLPDTRYASADTNPCFKEHNLSLKCLNDNDSNRDACQLYFENYKNCRKFWSGVKTERRSKGIKPVIPTVEEREKIKAEYLSRKNREGR